MISDKDVYLVELPEDEFDGLKEAKIEFIEKEIEHLDWYDKQLVKLYFYDNLSYRKIAELTKIPKTSIYNGITSIKNKIKNKL
jgi:DNA-directed RNA polymerase specialized sigma subunit